MQDTSAFEYSLAATVCLEPKRVLQLRQIVSVEDFSISACAMVFDAADSRILPATIVIVHVIGLYRVSVPIQTHKTPLFIVRKAHKAHTPVNIIRGFAQDHNVVRGGPRKGRPGRSHGEKVCRMGQHLTEFHNCTVFAHCYFLLVFLAGGRYNTDTGLPVVVGGSLHPALGGGDAEGFFFYLLAHYYITLSLYFNRHII